MYLLTSRDEDVLAEVDAICVLVTRSAIGAGLAPGGLRVEKARKEKEGWRVFEGVGGQRLAPLGAIEWRAPVSYADGDPMVPQRREFTGSSRLPGSSRFPRQGRDSGCGARRR